MQDNATGPYLTAIAQGGSLTGLSYTLAALGVAFREEAHSLAAEAVCSLGERSMRPKRAGSRLWHSWPAFLARYYTRETWRGLPGPWPVKAGLFALAVAEPGPYGEMALAAFAKWNGSRLARKAAGA